MKARDIVEDEQTLDQAMRARYPVPVHSEKIARNAVRNIAWPGEEPPPNWTIWIQ